MSLSCSSANCFESEIINLNLLSRFRIEWLNILKGEFYDSGYYALYNGILLALNILSDPNLKSDFKTEQINYLFGSNYPYGIWREKILELRKPKIDLGSWLEEHELDYLVEQEIKFGLLKDKQISVAVIDYNNLEQTLTQNFTNTTIILAQNLGYWLTIVYCAESKRFYGSIPVNI